MTAPELAIVGPGMRQLEDPRDATQGVTSTPTIALAIPWCPWIPERVESMARLRAALGLLDSEQETSPAERLRVREFREKLPNDRWSDQVFGWLAEQAESVGLEGRSAGADWCMQLQEDALVPENFWAVVDAIFEALPPEAQIVGFHVCHPIAGPMVEEDARFITTADALVGLCWAMRGDTMREFERWRRTELEEGWRDAVPPKGLPSITEDTMIGLFAMATGRRVWHPIPAIVDHDTSMRSVWGNDDHVNRRPAVSWKDAARFQQAWDSRELESPNYWRGGRKRVPHYGPDGVTFLGMRTGYRSDPDGRPVRDVGRFYDATPALARRWIKGFGERAYLRAMQDTGHAEKRLLNYARRARMAAVPKARVLICTPTRGGVDPRYATSVQTLAQLIDVDVESGFELLGSWLWHEQLVTVRSRFVRAFLETEATHLHFRDADVAADPACLAGMLQADREFVAAPYPRRDGVDFGAIRRAFEAGHPEHELPAESVAYDYAVRLLEETAVDAQACIEVVSLPLGCSLIKRELLERMVQHFDDLDRERVDLSDMRNVHGAGRSALVKRIDRMADELERWRRGAMGLRFKDLVQGRPHDTVALFNLFVEERSDLDGARILGSEDTAFCSRVRQAGGKVWMYLGPGSPADHVGEHVYRGHVEAFGLRRVAT